MPKLYRYKGFDFSVYSNEEPRLHVHASKAENEIRVLFKEIKDVTYWLEFETVRNKFSPTEIRQIENFVKAYREDIIKKINDFINNKKIVCETVNKIKKGAKKSAKKISKKSR